MKVRICTLLGTVGLLFLPVGAMAASQYHIAKAVSIPGDEGWDYLGVDDAARRVYVSHSSKVEVLDADSFEMKGQITGGKKVHGIALASDIGHGFISDGQANTVTVFDLKTLNKIASIPTGENTDSIIYDKFTHKVFAFNGDGGSASIIDVETNKVVSTLPLGGAPEFAATDGAGNVFVNLEDKSQMVKIDAKKNVVLNHWPLTPCEGPSALAIDTEHHRLFAGCHNKMVAVVNADTGMVIATPPIGDHVDAAVFDIETGTVMTSNGEGSITLIHEDAPDAYTVAGTIPTKKGSRTMALDRKTHNLYVPAAAFKDPLPTSQGEKPARPVMVSGSFSLLILNKE